MVENSESRKLLHVAPGNISVLQWTIKRERRVKLHFKTSTTVETAGKTFQTQENGTFMSTSLAKITFIRTGLSF